MRQYLLRQPLGSRALEARDFPLSLGGPGAAIVLPGFAAGEVAAHLGLADGAPFLQPAGVAAAVVADGDRLDGSTWLEDGARFQIGGARGRVDVHGDEWMLSLDHDGSDNATEPPALGEDAAAAPAEEVPGRQALSVAAFAPPAAAGPGAAAGRASRLALARRGALYAALALAAAVLAFLFAASAVSVRVAPDLDPDRAHFEGALLDVGSASHRLLLPGSYQLRVEKAGYRPARVPATVGSAAGQRFEVPLEKLPGRLTVDTQGLAARVSVDGRAAGRVPGVLEIAAGAHTLLIEAPRHEPLTQAVEIEGLGRSQALTVTLAPSFAAVRIESTPAGAAVVVDGVALGHTPVSTELDAGRRVVTLTHPEFRSWESAITVKAGEPQTVAPTLGLPDGRLRLETDPPGADVSVAGSYRGRTPLSLELVPGVAHEVLVTRAGYLPVTRTVRLEPRASQRLALPLVAELGEIDVSGEPADAELVVDGRASGAANQRLRLPTIAHVLEVRKPGLEPFRATVTPQAGFPKTVEYSLKTAAQLKAERFAATIRTPLGAVLKLLPAGSATLGSARREPGRRSNETQRRVEIRRPVYLALRAVTNLEFRAWKKDHLTGAFRQETLDLDLMPAANLSWQEAAEFCNWLSAQAGLPPAYLPAGGKLALATPVTTGYRLPTEAEWEYAARWNGERNDRKYPWGSELPIPPKAGNFGDERAIYLQTQILTGYDDGFRVAAPVGSFAASPLGFYDLGSNVLEWVSDYYTVYPEGAAPVVDPLGPADGDSHVIRGASWLTASVAELRLARRDNGSSGRQTLGFRIARYAE